MGVHAVWKKSDERQERFEGRLYGPEKGLTAGSWREVQALERDR